MTYDNHDRCAERWIFESPNMLSLKNGKALSGWLNQTLKQGWMIHKYIYIPHISYFVIVTKFTCQDIVDHTSQLKVKDTEICPIWKRTQTHFGSMILFRQNTFRTRVSHLCEVIWGMFFVTDFLWLSTQLKTSSYASLKSNKAKMLATGGDQSH